MAQNELQNTACLVAAYPKGEVLERIKKQIKYCKGIWNCLYDIEDSRKGLKPLTGKELAHTIYLLIDRYPKLREVDESALINVSNYFATETWKRTGKTSKASPLKKKDLTNSRGTFRCYSDGIAISKGFLHIPNIGYMKIRGFRYPGKGCWIKSISVHYDGYKRVNVSILFGVPDSFYKPLAVENYEKAPVGLDFCPTTLLVPSKEIKGYTLDGFKPYRKCLAKTAKINKRFLRKRKGSKNFLKLRAKIADLELRIANRRKDFIERVSDKLTKQFSSIFIEDLDIHELLSTQRKIRIGRTLNDNAWTKFADRLGQKSIRRGVFLGKVDRYFPSTQLCCRCGHSHRLALEERTYECPRCKLVLPRDLNAAKNIEKWGLTHKKEVLKQNHII